MYKKRAHLLPTYYHSRHGPKQLDYILVSRGFWRTTTDCSTTTDVDMGSDHVAVKMRSSVLRRPPDIKNTKKRLRHKMKIEPWPPDSISEYVFAMEKNISEMPPGSGVEEQAHLIESSIRESMKSAGTARQTSNAEVQHADPVLAKL